MMGKRKKKKTHKTKRTTMKQPQRLEAAKKWIPNYNGSNLVKGYAKRFRVNNLCAVKDLEMLGYTYSEEYKQNLKRIELQKQRDAEKRKERKRVEREAVLSDESDGTFAFIAGYTPGGFPFGLTWEEWYEIEDSNEQQVFDVQSMFDPEVAPESDYAFEGDGIRKKPIEDKDLPF